MQRGATSRSSVAVHHCHSGHRQDRPPAGPQRPGREDRRRPSPPGRAVRVATDPKHAGNLIITVQTTNPWAAPIVHPALDLARTPARRLIMDSPFRLGEIPDSGSDRRLTTARPRLAGPAQPQPRTGDRFTMSTGDTILTITGNLTGDPELRFTGTGIAVVAFTVAASRRVYDQATGKWQDGDTLFLRCSAWRELADHAAESLSKGMRVIVTGRLKQRSYETTEGEKRTVFEVDVEDVGPSLKWATAKVARSSRDKVPHPADGGDRWQASEPATVGADADWPPF